MMKHEPAWRAIRRELKQSGSPRGGPDAAAFWADFRARARLRVQDNPERVSVSPGAMAWRWSAVGACAVLIMAAVGFGLWPTSASALSSFTEVEVIAPHSAVLIMGDEGTQSTMLWVVDMTSESEPIGGSG